MDELGLVRRAREGDSDAFEEIFRIYYTRIYNYAYRLVGNAQDAEELTQESFLKAYRALQRGRQPANLVAWLYRIASNTCLDALRRHRLIHWQPLESVLTVLNIGGRNPEEQVLRSEQQDEQRARIEHVLAQLSPRYRMYLILREREGFSYQEIAAITGDSADTVKVTLYRARERAREIASGVPSSGEDGGDEIEL
jgi:RNA polymerase sigma-70 factor (ECF subfamily)